MTFEKGTLFICARAYEGRKYTYMYTVFRTNVMLSLLFNNYSKFHDTSRKTILRLISSRADVN